MNNNSVKSGSLRYWWLRMCGWKSVYFMGGLHGLHLFRGNLNEVIAVDER
jgi:hypothetical protein